MEQASKKEKEEGYHWIASRTSPRVMNITIDVVWGETELSLKQNTGGVAFGVHQHLVRWLVPMRGVVLALVVAGRGTGGRYNTSGRYNGR
jgi:hypothetical protein